MNSVNEFKQGVCIIYSSNGILLFLALIGFYLRLFHKYLAKTMPEFFYDYKCQKSE